MCNHSKRFSQDLFFRKTAFFLNPCDGDDPPKREAQSINIETSDPKQKDPLWVRLGYLF
jgi:hypothetical protein